MNCIGGVMVSVLSCSVVYRGFANKQHYIYNNENEFISSATNGVTTRGMKLPSTNEDIQERVSKYCLGSQV
jgi:hypothetical protein